MAGENKSVLGDFITLQRGKTYKGMLVGEPGPVLLGLGSIEPGGGFRFNKFKTYGGECPENLTLYPGDMYASLKGATKDGSMIGSVARVPPTIEKGRLTQDTVKLVFQDDNEELKRHIYWVLRSPQCRAYCAGHATGSAQVGLRREDFLAFEIPPLGEMQTRLTVLFEAIEDKIELNRRMNATLEEMARALFKSWFVDFDPVRAKREGRQPHGMDAATAELFPDEFEDSELGEIPKGWEWKSITSVADYINGGACQKFAQVGEEASLPVIKIRELNQGLTEQTDRVSTKFPIKHRADDGDVLFSWSGTLTCKTWTGGLGFVNQHIYRVSSIHFPRWFYLFWTQHHLSDFQRIAAAKATTMGHIKKGDLVSAMVAVPPPEVIDGLTQVIGDIDELIVRNSIESKRLASTRDALLPKLLSGELRVPDAEKIAVEVT
jgi:type I restriction enzyme S subunit